MISFCDIFDGMNDNQKKLIELLTKDQKMDKIVYDDFVQESMNKDIVSERPKR